MFLTSQCMDITAVNRVFQGFCYVEQTLFEKVDQEKDQEMGFWAVRERVRKKLLRPLYKFLS